MELHVPPIDTGLLVTQSICRKPYLQRQHNYIHSMFHAQYHARYTYKLLTMRHLTKQNLNFLHYAWGICQLCTNDSNWMDIQFCCNSIDDHTIAVIFDEGKNRICRIWVSMEKSEVK